MKRCTIALLGGSSAFTPSLAAALADRAETLPALDVRLWGRTAAHLAAVERFCNLHARARGVDHAYRSSLDLSATLGGADMVICQVRVGGFAGRSYDETFPLAHDLPGDETIGPGGLSGALRSVPTIVTLGRRAAALAPRAPFLLTSNPLGILLRSLGAVEGLRAFGLCELPERTLQRAAALVDLDAGTLTGDYVGVNHQGAFVAVRTPGGEDVLPRILARLAEMPGPSAFGVDGGAMQRQGLLWLPYARLYLHRERTVRAARQRRTDRGRELAALSRELFAHYAITRSPEVPDRLAQRDMPWHALALVPAVESLCDGNPRRLAVSAPNRDTYAWLPPDAIVERFGRQVPGGDPPPRPLFDHRAPRSVPLVRLLRQVEAFERSALRAARSPSPKQVESCLRACPLGLPPTGNLAALTRDVLRAAPAPLSVEVPR